MSVGHDVEYCAAPQRLVRLSVKECSARPESGQLIRERDGKVFVKVGVLQGGMDRYKSGLRSSDTAQGRVTGSTQARKRTPRRSVRSRRERDCALDRVEFNNADHKHTGTVAMV